MRFRVTALEPGPHVVTGGQVGRSDEVDEFGQRAADDRLAVLGPDQFVLAGDGRVVVAVGLRAVATAEPELDPPGMREGSKGFLGTG